MTQLWRTAMIASMQEQRDAGPWHEVGRNNGHSGTSVELGGALVDAADESALRARAVALLPGADLWRRHRHCVVAVVAQALADGRLHTSSEAPRLLPLGAAPPAAPAAAPPPRAASPRPAAAAPPPVVAAPELDVAAMVAVLQQAARDGVPFCEECERAAAQRRSAGQAA